MNPHGKIGRSGYKSGSLVQIWLVDKKALPLVQIWSLMHGVQRIAAPTPGPLQLSHSKCSLSLVIFSEAPLVEREIQAIATALNFLHSKNRPSFRASGLVLLVST